MNRIASFDILRIVGVYAVIWFHISGPSIYNDLAYAGLPALLMLSFALQYAGRPTTLGHVAKKRAVRLLSPWLVWCAIYTAVGLYLNRGKPFEIDLSFQRLVGGPVDHLWFLPFIYVGAIVVWFLVAISPQKHKVIFGVSLAGVAALLLTVLPNDLLFEYPFGQWIFSLPSVFLGAALGAILQVPERRKQIAPLLAILGLAGIGCKVSAGHGNPSGAFAYFVAVAVVVMAMLVTPPRWMKIRTDVSLGVYLLHPLAFWTWHRLFGMDQPMWIVINVVFAASAALTWALKRVPIVQRLL